MNGPRGYFTSAGENVGVDCRLSWVSRLIREVSPHAFTSVAAAPHTCYIHVEAERDAFDLRGFEPLTRGAWRRQGTVVIENVCTSGFDLLYRTEDNRPTFRFRWRPPLRDRVASAAAPSRFVLLARAALLQYPVLWLAPWMSVWKVINRLRAIAEHGGMTRSPDRRLTTHHVRQPGK